MLKSTRGGTEDNNDNKQNMIDKLLGTRPKQYQQRQLNINQKDEQQISNAFSIPFPSGSNHSGRKTPGHQTKNIV